MSRHGRCSTATGAPRCTPGVRRHARCFARRRVAACALARPDGPRSSGPIPRCRCEQLPARRSAGEDRHRDDGLLPGGPLAAARPRADGACSLAAAGAEGRARTAQAHPARALRGWIPDEILDGPKRASGCRWRAGCARTCADMRARCCSIPAPRRGAGASRARRAGCWMSTPPAYTTMGAVSGRC